LSFRRTKRAAWDESQLYERAVSALARRMRTVAELKRLLRQKTASQSDGEELISRIVERLKAQKYLDDSQYAAAYASMRRENEKLGRRRVITDLKVRGIHPEVIERAVSESYQGVNEEKLARQFLARKRLCQPASQRDAARVFRALARAGFQGATILKILKKWQVDEETLAALEEESAQIN